MIVADKKREQIIDGAIKRFSHFGIGKTTMNDIAEDLSVSKPSLYYYFPDKKSLIVGVIEKVFTDYFDLLKKKYNPDAPLETVLFQTIEIRNTFFMKYFMLRISEGLPDIFNDDSMKKKLTALKDSEKVFYAEIFERAKEKGEIKHENMSHIAELYLESLMGLTNMCIMELGKDLLPDKKAVNRMKQKQKDLSSIFTRGLSC
ncbi:MULTISPECIES: TetR/AcrR family transcriptional regulator [unclassified Pedobacter]|uniref:TetR/AcrR family transcriptional regulator n=1 Tax=Pedobacter TaxID=84567 RepID=UPI000B4B2DC5|nr:MULTISPECIES: TetR/AcrR family transcriptional regulator [unclassified Pedobacter]MCX2585976.1 TetR/AcrR family transcriptional regulator [Pedobacter sp. MR22-3]OWK72218.1 TetR family transcriptional regulator [Pedobacter sp. AJM]